MECVNHVRERRIVFTILRGVLRVVGVARLLWKVELVIRYLVSQKHVKKGMDWRRTEYAEDAKMVPGQVLVVLYVIHVMVLAILLILVTQVPVVQKDVRKGMDWLVSLEKLVQVVNHARRK